MAEAEKTNPFSKIHMLEADLFSTMAEADKTNPFSKIQILIGADLFPAMSEADRNRFRCSNRSCS